MTYELAKKLKDAGFPQHTGIDGDDLAGQIKWGFPIYGCVHGNKCATSPIYCETTTYYPKLGELIEACGENFGSIRNPVGDEWFAYTRDGEVKKCGECGDLKDYNVLFHGSTPEEAVANLWLELNKK